jgi:toxin ParE1/3/4
MVKISWSARALTDLKDIGEYIAKDSPRYAKMTLERIIVRVKTIEENPNIGRVVPELNQKDIREIISGNYRIIHQPTDMGTVHILTIHHCSRLLSNNPPIHADT